MLPIVLVNHEFALSNQILTRSAKELQIEVIFLKQPQFSFPENRSKVDMIYMTEF